MKFRFHIENCIGPWLSLGFHIDFKNLYADIHFLWWIISFGNLYWLDDAINNRLGPNLSTVTTELTILTDCPKCGYEYEIYQDLKDVLEIERYK